MKKLLFFASMFTLFFASPTFSFAQRIGDFSDPSFQDRNSFTPSSMMNFGYSPFGGFGWIFMIFWVVVIIGAVVLAVWFMSKDSGKEKPPHGEPPMEILKRRYAKGEIDKEEFEQKKKDLQ